MAALTVGISRPSLAADYQVGPGQPYESIGAVPWNTLAPGDQVLIHWRAEPYREKWVICVRGTAEAPITVKGIAGPGGELPVIDGQDAVTAPGQLFWNQQRGVIKIGGADTPPDLLPAYIVIEGLDVRSARPAYSFTAADGTTQAYLQNAAAIYVEKAEHLTVRGNAMHDSGNGLFVGTVGAVTQDVLVQSNYIYENGIDASDRHHNSYTEALGITFEFNHFGPLRAGSLGNNINDRSVGTIVRFNWIEGGNRQINLVEAEEDPASYVADPRYRTSFIYGNVIIERSTEDNSQIVHYGGDNGNEAIYRKGTLHFYNNTLFSQRSGHTTLLRLSSNDEQADVRNNLLYVTADGSDFAVLDESGTVALRNNWLKTGWVHTHNELLGAIDNYGTNVSGTDPGFADWNAHDYRLAQGSACVDAGMAVDPAVLPTHALTSQYVPEQDGEPRPADGPLDIGAFECAPGDCAVGVGGAPPGNDGPGGDDAEAGSGGQGAGLAADATLDACGCRLAGMSATSALPARGAARGILGAWCAALVLLGVRSRRRPVRDDRVRRPAGRA